jgi:AAA domain/DnaB-like helicase N terminal domain
MKQSPTHLHAFEGGAPPGFRQMPFNIDAEQGILGALLVKNEVFRRISDILRGEHFYESVHGRIFDVISRTIRAGRLADSTMLKVAFNQDPDLKALDGGKYLKQIAAMAEVALVAEAQAEEYARHIVELAHRRALIRAVEGAANEAYDLRDGRLLEEQLAGLRADIEQITQGAVEDDDGIIMLDDCALDLEAFWLIDDVMPRCNMAMIYGLGGCGKTYLATSLTFGVASGRWFMHEAEPGGVLYCAFERPRDAEDRLAALREKHGYKKLPVALKGLGGKKLDAALAEKIICWAHKLAETTGVPCKAIIMDTVAAALGGASEDAEGLGLLRVLGERIHAETGAMVIWVHHAGKSEGMGPRGHTTLSDGCLVWWHVEERESGDRVVHVEKANRGPVYEPIFSFKLSSFEAGRDKRGKAINLCAVEMTELKEALTSDVRVRYGAKKRKEKSPDAGLGSRQKILMHCLRRLANRNPEGVERAMVRSHYILEMNTERRQAGKKELAGKEAAANFRQTLMYLKDRGHLTIEGEMLFPND